MITLKLATYSQNEANELARLLAQLQLQLCEHCRTNSDCSVCPYRHLCLDLSQATMYAEEYEATR